jgi:hypothetical protein
VVIGGNCGCVIFGKTKYGINFLFGKSTFGTLFHFGKLYPPIGYLRRDWPHSGGKLEMVPFTEKSQEKVEKNQKFCP